MKLARLDSPAAVGWPRVAVAVGNFDGVHRGHQAIVREAVEAARARAGTAVVLTFDPHPARVLTPRRAPAALMTLEQKAEALSALGPDRLAVLPFTPEVAALQPEDFARTVLLRSLAAQVVVVGDNFRFGRGREGGLGTLQALGRSLGFQVLGLRPVLHQGTPISSTRVRDAVASGAVEEARALLGRPFAIDGTVVRGEGRGRQIGMPTANLEPLNEALPAGGVYACGARLPGQDTRALAVVNVGHRPTFGGGKTLAVEAHLPGFEGDLYGARLRLEFEARLREERPFPGPEALVAQIRLDIERARELFRPG